MVLKLMPATFAVCKLSPNDRIPNWVTSSFFSITKTTEELSIVCEEHLVPEGVRKELGWRCLMVQGPLDFGMTGVLSSIAEPLARVEVSIFTVSTFDTDYILVKNTALKVAIAALRGADHVMSDY